MDARVFAVEHDKDMCADQQEHFRDDNSPDSIKDISDHVELMTLPMCRLLLPNSKLVQAIARDSSMVALYLNRSACFLKVIKEVPLYSAYFLPHN